MQTQANTQIPTDHDTDQPLYAHQVALEQLYDKNQLHKRLRQEFIETGFNKTFEYYEIPPAFGFDLLCEMELRKRCDPATMVGLLRRHYRNDLQATANMLYKCVILDIVDYDLVKEELTVCWEVPPEVRAELDRFQYPLPMVVPPRPITSNSSSGYLMRTESVILRHSPPEDDVCLDHLDRVNNVALEIDDRVLSMVKNTWKGLDKQKKGETYADFRRRKRAFAKFDRTARDVINKLEELGKTHYLTHRYDFRGRTYCCGYHVNYQGNDWNKAITCLANKEITK